MLRKSCYETFCSGNHGLDHALRYGTWGKAGVYHILDRMRKAGIHRVYWRALLGSGQAEYPSRVTDIGRHFDPENNQFTDVIFFDFLKGGDYLVPCFDKEGWWCMGYEPSVAEAFQKETG